MRGIAVVFCALALSACVIGEDPELEGELQAGLDSPSDVKLVVDKSESRRNVRKGIPIGTSAKSAPIEIAYAAPLRNVDPSEKLRIVGQVTISRCNEHDLRPGGNHDGIHTHGYGDLNSPCEDLRRVGSYDPTQGGYAPKIAARLVLTRRKDSLSGHALTRWRGYACKKKIHHCPIAVHAVIDNLSAPPGSPRWVTLQVKAWSSDARNGHLAELEADCENDDYGNCDPITGARAQTKGQITVVRIGTDATKRKSTTHRLLRDTIPISTKAEQKPSVVLMSMPVKHLQPGDVIDVRSMFAAKNDGNHNGSYVFDHFLGTHVVLVSKKGRSKPRGAGERWITPKNGKNCQPGRKYCRRVGIGAVRVPGDIPSSTMFVNVIGVAVEKSVNQTNVRVKVLRDPQPELRVRCFSKERTGGAAPCGF